MLAFCTNVFVFGAALIILQWPASSVSSPKPQLGSGANHSTSASQQSTTRAPALPANVARPVQASASNNTDAHQHSAGHRPTPAPHHNHTGSDTSNNTSDDNNHHDDNGAQEPPRRQQQDEYLIGVGIADITGPAADINLEAWGDSRVLYVSIDAGMVSQLLRLQVLKRLEAQYGSSVFNESNVMLTATHSHSCPGGYFQYWLYNIPSAGFISQTLDALVAGIVRSVGRARNSLTRGRMYFAQGDLLGASINRSPTAYANNPRQERAQYEHNTDNTMAVLRLVDLAGDPLAMVSWFAVHGTSMNNSNRLISSDNKGYASLLFEAEFNAPNTLPGKGKFVAIFAQANEGDVSPNTAGPRCARSGLPCDAPTSSCAAPAPEHAQDKRWRRAEHSAASERRTFAWLAGLVGANKLRWSRANNQPATSRSAGSATSGAAPEAAPAASAGGAERCVAPGPGRDMFESTRIIAWLQYARARQLFAGAREPVAGPIRFVHEHIDMSRQLLPAYSGALELAARAGAQQVAPHSHANGSLYRTCPAALGYSFAAGTIDGPGAFDFQQGDTASTPAWNLVRDILRRPTPDHIACHEPKPILVSTGQMDFPYMWHPSVVPTQVLLVGQVAIVGLPGEFTSMAGRRMRAAVQAALDSGCGAACASGGAGAGEAGDDEVLLGADTQPANRTSPPRPFRVVLSGLSNIYTSYVTTVEEYAVQRYEGASTLYGPHTLQAYVNQFARLARHLSSAPAYAAFAPGPLRPPDLTASLFSLRAGVIYDGTTGGHTFGQVLEDANTTHPYRCGQLVSVAFVAGHPRNDLRQESSFLYVDRYAAGADEWLAVASDASWDTKYIWGRTSTLRGESRANIQWQIGPNCEPGIYRIRHYGSAKSLLQTVAPYAGRTSPFVVLPAPATSGAQARQQQRLESQLRATLAELAARETSGEE